MRKQTVLRLAVALTVLAVVCTLAPVWWWALVGMGDDVGNAWFATWALLVLGAVVAWMVWVEADA